MPEDALSRLEDKPRLIDEDQRQEEKLRYETLSSFSLHLRREEEPVYPRAAQRWDDKAQIALVEKEHAQWTIWATEQPDATLLTAENALYTRVQHSPFRLPKHEIEAIRASWQEEIAKLRKDGHTEIIDKYWPHLSKSISSNK